MAGGVIALLKFASLNLISQVYSDLEDNYKILRLEGNLNYIKC